MRFPRLTGTPSPGAAPALDPRADVARGLVAAYDFTEPAARDLTSLGSGRWSGGNGQVVGRAGRGLQITSASASSGASPRARISSAITVLWVAEKRGGISESSDFLFGDFVASNGDYNWGFYESQASGNLVFYVHNGTTGVNAGAVGLWTATSGPRVWVATYGGGDSNIRLYLNGIEVASAAQTGNVRAAANTVVRSCGWQSGARNHQQHLAAVWNRRLSLAEIAAVSTNPRRLVEPERRIWLPAAVAGGGGSVGLAVEADAALGLTGSMAGAAGLATETDSALALQAVQIGSVGLATETDLALGLSSVQSRAVGLAAESDEAFALAAVQRLLAGLATETDEALALDPGVVGSVGLAQEQDTALQLVGRQILPVGLAVESDQALALSSALTGSVGLATEADTAWALQAVQRLTVGLALEVDLAFALSAGGGAPSNCPTAEEIAAVVRAGLVEEIAAAVWAHLSRTLTSGAAPTPEQVADAVWGYTQ